MSDLKLHINTSSSRLPEESFESYKKRREKLKKAYKLLGRGKPIWNSNLPITSEEGETFKAGTYIKSIHGDIKKQITEVITNLKKDV